MPRAQTTMDFLVGTTVFLLTLSAVLVTVPGLSDPFVTGHESDTIIADRAAEALSTDILVSSTADPFVFRQSTVSGFFGQSKADAKDQLGIESSVNINATLANESTQRYAVGDAPPDSVDTSVAWRSGRLEGDDVELVVRVW